MEANGQLYDQFNPAESVSDEHWPECIMDLRTGLGDEKDKKGLPIPGIESRFLAHPSRSPVSVQTNRNLLGDWNQGRWGKQDTKGRQHI